MHFKLFYLLGASSLVSAVANAPVTHGNNPYIKYRAILPKSDSTPIRGVIDGHASKNGSGLTFNIKFTDLPVDGGPYLYHIHESPVPADGNCTGTGGHLDPYSRGETPACDSTAPASCQVGDLSGKHGKPASGSFIVKYHEAFVSSVEGTPAFFGNRSVVIHNKDKVRLTCASFHLVQDMNSTSSTLPTSTSGIVTASGTGSSSPATGSPIVTGSAARNGLSVAVALLAVAAAFLL